MAFWDIQSTALVPYDSCSRSALHWNDRPRITQDYVIKKSFQAQIADHNHFQRDGLRGGSVTFFL